MKKDIISKDILKTLIKDIAKFILKIELDDFEIIDKELLKIEKREADIVIKTKNQIYHIEIQNSNDNDMIYRMLRYYSDLKYNFKNSVINQYVIYIGKNRLNMKNELSDKNINFKYNLIDIREIDCETFLRIDTPDALVISILCDFNNKNEKDVVYYIIKRLKELTDEKNFRNYMLMLEVLSENRNLKNVVKKGEEMITKVDYTKLPSFELGLEKGIQQGLQQGLQQGIKEGLKKSIKKLKKAGFNEKDIANLLEVDIEFVIEALK